MKKEKKKIGRKNVRWLLLANDDVTMVCGSLSTKEAMKILGLEKQVNLKIG